MSSFFCKLSLLLLKVPAGQANSYLRLSFLQLASEHPRNAASEVKLILAFYIHETKIELMKTESKIILVLAILVWIVLAWAPWMDDKAIHDKVFEEKARIDGTIDKRTGEIICDYEVSWVPFGRWVASCEGGYFVTFWGKIV